MLHSRKGRDGGTILQRIIVDRSPERRSLYWRTMDEAGTETGYPHRPGGALHLAAGSTLGFDTYFNVFFEAQWWRYTALESVTLEVILAGAAVLRLYRHALGRKVLVVEQVLNPGATRVRVPHSAINFRQNGMLSFELRAGEKGFTFLGGAWLSENAAPTEARLAVVFCTFNREVEIARVLRSIADDEIVADHVARIFVVNQGGSDLLSEPGFAEAADILGDKLTLIEQANFGGAGGFSRGLLDALAEPELTHAVLLDDDLELEPDSLLRMAAFFSYCERHVVLGGHMLDLLQPTRLYEAGGVISDRHWNFLPQQHMRDLSSADELEPLSHPYAIHYNGWWCCGFALEVVRDHGMPLPCFIRGDDMEFGLRLHERGVPTIPMPGIAVWHEPFYLKLGGWQLYYETRNMLVAAALHRSFQTKGVVRRMGRQIIVHLLTYRYYSTALILQGVRDFLAGPSVVCEPPMQRHSALAALKNLYPLNVMPREQVLAEQVAKPIPAGKLRCLVVLAWLLARNAFQQSCMAPPRILRIENLHWATMRTSGHIAAETWWDEDLPAYRRCRKSHRKLLLESAALLVRLAREAPGAAAAWRKEAPTLTSIPFWYKYLGLNPTALGEAENLKELATRAYAPVEDPMSQG